MSEHCIINGERCSECCKVLSVYKSKSFIEWTKYVRRYGYPDDFDDQNKVYHRLREISKRRAKKLNPYLVGKFSNNRQSFFKCINYNGKGCSDYNNRPQMCSGYPHYGRSVDEFEKTDEFKEKIGYRIDCTYLVESEV
jgi:Fe-S-cluster containining protein